jgi:predicted nucleotidyltransferase
MIKEEDSRIMFKCVVGSQAHGLATPDSDFDYRGVFIVPTFKIVQLGKTPDTTSWIEGKDDDTTWELGHFLHLATKCNPTILETFLSPVTFVDDNFKKDVDRLLDLFPHVWNSKAVHDAFLGYAHNQRKKLLHKEMGRPHKYAAAYLRVLYNAEELLNTGTFTIRIKDTEMGEYIAAVKNKSPLISLGNIIDKCEELENRVHQAYENNPDKETDIDIVNRYLIDMREKYFHVF